MKKGDRIKKVKMYAEGELVTMSLGSRSLAEQWITRKGGDERVFLGVNEDNAVIALNGYTETTRAIVNWIIGDEVAINLGEGENKIINLIEEPEWIVEVSASPSPQSEVENMSDEQLKASLDALRLQRKRTIVFPDTTVRKTRAGVAKGDPLEEYLKTLTPEAQVEMRKKLGMA